MEKQEHKTNRLINSSSPYLIQHANNPVDWYEWGEEAFEKAKKENKLLLVSIGYSACHWCHVMAHESFEDKETANLMSQLFVNIKVDREELPDVDQLYMDACQLISGNGGWPLNAFALPDKRPIHALTYLPKPQWQKLLKSIAELWQNNPDSAIEYAEKLGKGISNMGLPPALVASEVKPNMHLDILNVFANQFDSVYGGPNRAPKFPMPNNQMYLLHHANLFKDNDALKMVDLTLTQMYLGGIYDAVGGGFARYSVDAHWFAPHFEKMLYDNAQLIGVYAYAYAITKNEEYKRIALESIQFCNEELKNATGLYQSALDADSEGVEGLYYIYTYEELESVLGNDAVFFSQYFQCKQGGNWEHNRNILYAINPISKAAKDFEMDETLFRHTIQNCLKKLNDYRSQRIKPGLDYKCICSWNALQLKGLAQAGLFLRHSDIIEEAIALEQSISDNFFVDGQLMRIFSNGKSKIHAFLEDYACLCDAWLQLYQCTFNESYLLKAKSMIEFCLKTFYHADKGFFKFSSDPLVSEKYDTSDDVINSGNSIIAQCMYKISWYFDLPEWRDIVTKMRQSLSPLIEQSAPWYSNWADLQIIVQEGMQQIIVSGEESDRSAILSETYTTQANAIFGFAGISSEIPLFQHKYSKNERKLYICNNQTCYAPVAYI